MLANLITLQKVSESDFRQMFPQTSFPEVLTDVVTVPHGYGVITSAEIPQVPEGMVLHEGPIRLIGSKPVRTWQFKEAPINPPAVQSYVELIQKHLDKQAQLRSYDSILSLCSYASSSDRIFAAEAAAGIECRDACWRLSYDLLAQAEVDPTKAPTPEELQAMLPAIKWPTMGE